MKEQYQVRCFVNQDGYVYSLQPDGTSNYPADIEVVGDLVRVLGEHDDLGPGREIVDEFVLWPSLLSIALAIERPDSESSGISLNVAVYDAHIHAEAFKTHWLEANYLEPEKWPLVIANDEAGHWNEALSDFGSYDELINENE